MTPGRHLDLGAIRGRGAVKNRLSMRRGGSVPDLRSDRVATLFNVGTPPHAIVGGDPDHRSGTGVLDTLHLALQSPARYHTQIEGYGVAAIPACLERPAILKGAAHGALKFQCRTRAWRHVR